MHIHVYSGEQIHLKGKQWYASSKIKDGFPGEHFLLFRRLLISDGTQPIGRLNGSHVSCLPSENWIKTTIKCINSL